MKDFQGRRRADIAGSKSMEFNNSNFPGLRPWKTVTEIKGRCRSSPAQWHEPSSLYSPLPNI